MSRRILLPALLLLAIVSTPAQADTPSPGAAGLGDRLSPLLGNGGYDARHYDLDVRYATSAPAQPIDGTVTIRARATQALSQFDLDFAGEAVGAVAVDGRPAQWRRDGEELVITPRRPLRDGERFLVTVSHFTATPTVPGDDPSSTALFVHEDGSATAGQPFYAHLVYPSNDHPRDKASFTFRLDVPAGHDGGRQRPPARPPHPRRAAPSGATCSASRWRPSSPSSRSATSTSPGAAASRGVLLRDVTAAPVTAELLPKLAVTPAQLDWMEDRVARYPFDIYGSLVVRADLGFALETQTLSIFDISWFEAEQGLWDPTMLHELAHEWFGNSVAPYEWSDLWLNEGHASWYEFVWAEEQGFLAVDTEFWPDPIGYPTLEALMRAVYAHGDQWRRDFGPVALPTDEDAMFSFQSYHGGALVLYALRNVVGDATFERIERAWVRRYRGRSASTADFIALASRVARRDLGPFLRDWVYGERTPPMPGHPDWTVDPVTAAAPQARTLPAPGRPRP